LRRFATRLRQTICVRPGTAAAAATMGECREHNVV
jgi:hypothetical protein